MRCTWENGMSETLILDSAYALSLTRVSKLSPGVVSTIMSRRPDDLHALQDYQDWFATVSPGMPAPSIEDVCECEDVVRQTLEHNIFVIPITSSLFPRALREIDDCPPVIYLKGNIDLLAREPGVAVVGTRKASPNGLTIAARIAAYFSARDWTIVSGLAFGIDAAAHRGALEAHGPTIAVLAHGLRAASPKGNAHLAQEILDKDGAWLSEYPIDVGARPEQFVFRNRIQIGLSAGSIIVEGELRSGSMAQAEFCLRNKRLLFAVLPDSRARNLGLVSSGTSMLVDKRGAIPIRTKDDYPSVLGALARKRSELSGQV